MRRTILFLIGLAAVGGLYGVTEGQEQTPKGATFTDITKESGIADIVAQHYEKYPNWWLSGLHLVDVDGDGKLDLFLSSHGKGRALAALGDGKGHFTVAPGNHPTSEIHLAYDADEDGKLDLTMTHTDGGGKWWLNRSKPGELSFEGTKIERGGNTARRQAMIDLDRDGKVDWLRGLPKKIVVERGDGKGNFTPFREIPLDGGGQNESLCLPLDIDGDGYIDLLVEFGGYDKKSPSNCRILRNDGKGNFIDVTKEAGLPLSGVSIKGAGDVNRDGFPDLFVLEDKVPQIYLNNGKGHFTKKEGAIRGMEKATRPAYASWGLAVVVDFDNDGTADIIWNGRNFLWVFRGKGDGTFDYMNKAWGIRDTSSSSVDDGLCFGDINGDGALDIIGYASIGNKRLVSVYRNDLPKQHWLNVRPIGLPGNKGAAGAKIRVTAPKTGELLSYEQVAIYDSQAAFSYYSYAVTERHFGLGQREQVDVSVEFYPSGVRVERTGVSADQTIEISEPASKKEK